VWIDEADESINLWSIPEFDITSMSKVEGITLVSATFNSIIKKYERIKVIPLTTTYPDTYLKIEECNIIEDCTAGNSIEYLKAVLNKYSDAIKKPGVRLFAPGDIEIASHDAIADFLGTQGFAVMVLNGKRKCIIIPGRPEPINIDSQINEEVPESLGEIMTRIYIDNGLYNYPFAVTGYLCLGRGLTFQNEDFLFDFGIMSNIIDGATAYQCICRMVGNVKGFKAYNKPPTIITTTRMKETVLRQERIAVQLAKMVHDNELSDVGEEEFYTAGGGDVTQYRKEQDERIQKAKEKTDRKALGRVLDDLVRIEEFSSLEELRTRWNVICKEANIQNPTVPGKGIHKEGEKFKCAIGKNSHIQNTVELRNWLIKSGVASWGSELSNVLNKPNDERKGEIINRVYVGYEGDIPTFFLRYITIPDTSSQ
jgi:hypothetical protein